MLALGNEFGIPQAGEPPGDDRVGRYFRRLDPTRLYAEGSNNEFGNPTVNPNDDYFTTFRTGRAQRPVRGSFATVDAPAGARAGRSALARWPTYRDIDRRHRRAGHRPRGGPVHGLPQLPRNRQVHRRDRGCGITRSSARTLAIKGMLDQADDFFHASGRWPCSVIARRSRPPCARPGFGGFQLLDIMDYQEQGTALVGILDAFMDCKGLIRPDEWRRVLLRDRAAGADVEVHVDGTDETFTAAVEVAHYGPAAVAARPCRSGRCSRAHGQDCSLQATWPRSTFPQGGSFAWARSTSRLTAIATPQKLTLELRLPGHAVS